MKRIIVEFIVIDKPLQNNFLSILWTVLFRGCKYRVRCEDILTVVASSSQLRFKEMSLETGVMKKGEVFMSNYPKAILELRGLSAKGCVDMLGFVNN